MFTVFRKGKPADRHAGLQVVPQQSPQGRGWEPEPCSEPGAGAAPGCGEAVLLHPKLGTSLTFVFHLFPVGEAHSRVSPCTMQQPRGYK